MRLFSLVSTFSLWRATYARTFSRKTASRRIFRGAPEAGCAMRPFELFIRISMDIRFRRIYPGSGKDLTAARALLAAEGLDLDHDVSVLVAGSDGEEELVCCAGLARDVVKCVTIRADLRGEGLALPLMTEVTATAWEMGERDLFLYTKPENEPLFAGCGFVSLALVPGAAVLMENNKRRLPDYCRELETLRRPGEAVGLVMNCNPFTLGHRFLVMEAVRRADHVHLFVVREEGSEVPYEDRLALVRQGVAGIPDLTVHPGSVYLISRATFPSYFLKDAAEVDKAFTGIDIQIFRKYIAPALGITRRLVGTEPYSAITRRYNEDLAYWLATPDLAAPPVILEILERLTVDGEPVSASRVRELWRQGDENGIRRLVPETTYAYLQAHHPVGEGCQAPAACAFKEKTV